MKRNKTKIESDHAKPSFWINLNQIKNLPSKSSNFFKTNFLLKVFELHFSWFYEWQMISTQMSPRTLDIVRSVNASSSSSLLLPLATLTDHFIARLSSLLLIYLTVLFRKIDGYFYLIVCLFVKFNFLVTFPWDAQIRLTLF